MPTAHTVQQGECFSSIADQYGILRKTLWDHPENAELRQLRKDPSVLYPGDIVNVPDMEPKAESKATDARHRFKTKGEPNHIKIRLLVNDKPRAGVAYELEIDGKPVSGSTDGDGYLKVPIPPGAQSGVLRVKEGTIVDVFQLGFGTLDPIETDEGVRERLMALGYEVGEDLAAAVRAFQSKEKMTANGNIDASLQAKLKEKFGQ